MNTPPRASLSIVVMLSAACSAASPATPVSVTEQEPNDTLATATPTGLTDLGTVIVAEAEIGNGPLVQGDRDFFSFEVTAEAELPVLLTVAMVGDDDFDGYVRLFDSAQREVTNNDDGDYPNPDPLLQIYLVEPGTYYVAASHALNPGFSPTDDETGRWAEMGSYELAIIIAGVIPPDDPSEPNDGEPVIIETVPALISNQFIGDGPNGWNDVDPYVVNIAAPAILIAEVRPTHLGLLDPFIGLDAENVPLHSRIKRIERAVFEGDQIGISVRGTDPAAGEFFSTGYYELFIDVIPVAAGGGPFEPNDSLLEATPTGLTGPGSVKFAAFIGDGVFGEIRGDVDFYEVLLAFDERLEVSVSPNGKSAVLDPVVHVYDFLGTKVATWPADDAGNVFGEFERPCEFVFFDKEVGPWPYTVAVMGARDRITMDPLIPNPDSPGCPTECPPSALFAIDGGPGSTGDYEATFTIATGLDCTNEPDDTIGDVADSVLAGEGEYVCGSGVIGDSGCSPEALDVDLYRVTVETDVAVLDAAVSVCHGGEVFGLLFDPAVRLFDAAGQELTSSDAASLCSHTVPNPAACVRYQLSGPAEYFVGVSGFDNLTYDPFVPCSGDAFGSEPSGPYKLKLVLVNRVASGVNDAPVNVGDADDPGRLFATLPGETEEAIVELDPQTGEMIGQFAAPEPFVVGSESLAFDGVHLHFLGGADRYPFLYRLDPDTGDVLDKSLTWFGSGYYGDMVALGENLHFIDLIDLSIHTVRTDGAGPVSRLDIGLQNNVSLFGPLAATLRPDRLYAPDAADPTIIHALDPVTGALLESVTIGAGCDCDADFDNDGDVDDDDRVFFDDCDEISYVPFGCGAADLNCDADIDELDVAIFDCQHNGPDQPPNPDCCPADLPTVSPRATSLAGTGPNVLVAGDWALPELELFDPAGASLGSLQVDAPVGSMAGRPFVPFGDADNDGDVDLLDWRTLQTCFTGSGGVLTGPDCPILDFDLDQDVDLFDYSAFLSIVTGVEP